MENGEEKSWEFVREETTRKTNDKRGIWRMERLKAINKLERGSVYGQRVKGKRKKVKRQAEKKANWRKAEKIQRNRKVRWGDKDSFSKEKEHPPPPKKKPILMIVCVRKVERKR